MHAVQPQSGSVVLAPINSGPSRIVTVARIVQPNAGGRAGHFRLPVVARASVNPAPHFVQSFFGIGRRGPVVQ